MLSASAARRYLNRYRGGSDQIQRDQALDPLSAKDRKWNQSRRKELRNLYHAPFLPELVDTQETAIRLSDERKRPIRLMQSIAEQVMVVAPNTSIGMVEPVDARRGQAKHLIAFIR
jgi:hypothetical protein